MNEEFEGISQETVDSIRADLESTQEQQQDETLEAAGVSPEQPTVEEPAPEAAPQEREAGQDGSVRDVAGAVKGALGSLDQPTIMTQAADAVAGMLGLGTPEERQQQREEGRAELEATADQAIENDAVGSAVADTLVRAVPGGALDAAEDVLSAGEVIGDTVKTFASLGNVHESQNPFSSNYDWAQWKLGADEIGAKTPVGQFAQELVSFAAIGSRLGAFKSFQGAQAGVKGALKAGAIEAGYGMATDALKGLAGEGNFANMLEQLVPGLKDTWVTALAVDEDNNPWEAAVKSALDGAAIGFPVGAIGAMASGIRAAKNLPAEQQTEKLIEVFAEQVKQTELPLGLTKVKKLEAYDVAREMQDGDFSRIDQISDDAVRELVDQNGYDITAFTDTPADFAKALGFRREMDIFGQGTITKQLRNGSEIDWSITKLDQAAEDSTYRIDWDISKVDAEAGGLGEGAAGVEMFSQIKEVVREADLKPGTIIQTEAAKDSFKAGGGGASEAQTRAFKKGRDAWYKKNSDTAAKLYDETYGEGAFKELEKEAQIIEMQNLGEAGKIDKLPVRDDFNKRAKLYERAGFSAPDEEGTISAIVKADKSGRKVFEPLDVNGDIDAQIAKAKETGATQLSLPAVEVVADRVQAGVPVYWDDVAETVPELFTPGTRVIENPEFPPEVLARLRDPGYGVSINPFTGEEPTTGFMVAVDGKTLKSFEDIDIQDFIAQNYDILTREDAYLGAWVSEITGKPVVEISRRVESLDDALNLGKAFDQEGIFDTSMKTGDDGYHPTGGIDRLKETQGYHQKSAYTTKNYVRTPADPQSIARNQFTPGAPGGSLGGRIMTDEQLHILGDSLPANASRQLDEVMRGMDVKESDVLADMKISQKELRDRVSSDLSDFIDADGRVDLNKLPTMAYGDDVILTREGALQTRVLIHNIAGSIWDEARTISMKDGQSIDTEANLEVMVDGIKALARLRKKTVNMLGTRLGDEAMKIKEASLFETQFTPKGRKAKAEAKVFSDDTADAIDKALDEMVDGFKSGDPKRIRQAKRTAQFMELTGGDPTKMAKVAKGIPMLYGDVALKHMFNSLLSSPATHIVNTLSNAVVYFERPLTAAMGGEGKAAAASFYNFGEMLKESWDLAGRTWQDMGTAQGSKFGTADSGTEQALANLAERVSTGQANNAERIHSGVLHMLNDVANHPLLNWPNRFLTTGDEFFKAMNARAEYRVQTYLKAQMENPGNPQAAFEEMLVKYKDQAFGKGSGRIMDDGLLEVAKKNTFQNDLKGWAGEFARFVNGNPALRSFFPFIKTGHNIMVYTGEHVPVLNFALEESRKALRGDMGKYQQAVAKGQMALGGMVMAGAGVALASDRLTGSGPPPGPRRDAWLKNHEPRSIKIGDEWVSYARLEPFGWILNSVADVYEAFNSGQLEEDQASYRVGYLMYALSTNLSDKTFFSGVKDLATLLNPSGPGAVKSMENIVYNKINGLLPASGLRRARHNALTPYRMEYANATDRAKEQLGLPITPPAPVINPLDGQPIEASAGGFSNAILPIKAVTKGTDIVYDGLEAIEFSQSETRKELGDIKLSPEQMGRLNELMAETGLHRKLKKLMSNPKWGEAVREHQQAINDGSSNVPKEQQLYYRLVKDKWSEAQQIALKMLFREDPELHRDYLMNKRTRKDARMGQVQGLLNLGIN